MLRPGTLQSMLDEGDIVNIAPEHLDDVQIKCTNIIRHIDQFLKIANHKNPINSMRFPRLSGKIHQLNKDYSAMREDTEKLQAWAQSAYDSDRTSISAAELVKFYELVVTNALLAEQLKTEDFSQAIKSITTTVVVTIAETEIAALYESIRRDHLFVVIDAHTENRPEPEE